MDDSIIVKNESVKKWKLIVYSIFVIVSLIFVIVNLGNDPPTKVGVITTYALFCIVFLVLLFRQVIATRQGICLSTNNIEARGVLSGTTVKFGDIISVTLEYLEHGVGFSRLRLLEPFYRDNSLPTTLTYKVDTDGFILIDTISNVDYKLVQAFVDELVQTTEIQPHINQIDTQEFRGTQVYFSFRNYSPDLNKTEIEQLK